MKPKKIKSDLEKLKTDLESLIKKIGSRKASELSGQAQRAICDFSSGRAKWSWEKIIDISMKLEG